MAGRHLPQAALIGPVARAQHHNLAVGVGKHPIGHLQQQVHPLLIHQTAHHAHQVSARIHREPEALLQGLFIDSPRRQIRRAEISRKSRICGWIPVVGVNAVENATQLAADVVQQPLKLFAVLGRADFLGIGG